jgi:hypothetical protein
MERIAASGPAVKFATGRIEGLLDPGPMSLGHGPADVADSRLSASGHFRLIQHDPRVKFFRCAAETGHAVAQVRSVAMGHETTSVYLQSRDSCRILTELPARRADVPQVKGSDLPAAGKQT